MSVLDGWYFFDNDMNAVTAALSHKEFVVSGLTVAEKGVPDMSVDVAAGTYYADGTKVVKGAPTNLAIGASDPVDFRKDIVVGDSAGVLSIVAGVANSKSPAGGSGPTAFRPVPPDIPATKVLIAEVWIEAGETTILDADITDRRVIHPDEPSCARVYRSALQAIPNNAFTAVSFDNERFDTDSIWVIGTPTVLTCQTAGKYLIIGNVAWEIVAGGRRILRIWLNSATEIASVEIGVVAGGGTEPRQCVSTIYDLAVGHFVELQGYQNQGGVVDILSSANYSPEFMMVRVG